MWRWKLIFYFLISLKIHQFTESFLPKNVRIIETCFIRTSPRPILFIPSPSLHRSSPLNAAISSAAAKRQKEILEYEIVEGDEEVPAPLDRIVDVNIERNSIVYELSLSRDLGFDINQGFETPVVGKVQPGSKAAALGVLRGDNIVATSATVGGQIWYHDTVESVKSAITTRFVLNSEVVVRFERKIPQIPSDLLPYLKVPYYYFVRLKRPLGLHIKENSQKEVIVEKLVSNLSAYRSALMRVGDQIIAMSATWGDKLWDVKSVESFIVAVKMRSDNYITLKCKRMIPLSASMERLMQGKSLVNDRQYFYEEEDGRKVYYLNSSQYQLEKQSTDGGTSTSFSFPEGSGNEKDDSHGEKRDEDRVKSSPSSLLHYDTIEYLKFIKSNENLIEFWQYLLRPSPSRLIPFSSTTSQEDYLQFHNHITNQTIFINIVDRSRLDTFAINKLMSKALEYNNYQLAIEIFETVFQYDYYSFLSQQEKEASVFTSSSSYSIDEGYDNSRGYGRSPRRSNGGVGGTKGRKSEVVAEEGHEERELYEILKKSENIEENTDITWKTISQQEERQDPNLQILIKDTIDLTRLTYPDSMNPSQAIRECLAPNNFILPTIMKAYGRKKQLKPIEYLIPWMEKEYNVTADIYSFSSLLYAYAKFQKVAECEQLFYEEIPRRNLTINTVTINSFMYLYTKLNRPMDALKLYDIIKENMKKKDLKNKSIVYNEYTFSILIKSLLISNNKRLHSIVFDIIDNLPSIGIYPTIDLYNQLFEYYSMTYDYKKIKEVIKRIMDYNRILKRTFPGLGNNDVSDASKLSSLSAGTTTTSSSVGSSDDSSSSASSALSPPVIDESDFIEAESNNIPVEGDLASPSLPPAPPTMINTPQKVELNLRSYSHIIFGYANAKLPKSALSIYLMMRRKGLQPDKYIYTGILKALYWLKDYLSSIQIIEEMVAKGKVIPDEIHYAQAMQTCLIANKGELAEELIKFYLAHNVTTILGSSITGRSWKGKSERENSRNRENQFDSSFGRGESGNSNYRKVDIVLCTLWLHALLQQSKWKEAMNLFYRMNEDHASKMKRITSAESSFSMYDRLYLSPPNRQALEILLKYQILHQRYSDAYKTMERIIYMYSNQLSKRKQTGAMASTINILAVALGAYATTSLSSYQRSVPPDNDNLWMFSFYDDYHKIYSKYSTGKGNNHSNNVNSNSENLNKAERRSAPSNSPAPIEAHVPNINILNEFSFQHVNKIIEEDEKRKQREINELIESTNARSEEEEEELHVTTAAEFFEQPINFEESSDPLDGNVPSSSGKQKQSLFFLMKVIERIAEQENILISSDFYCDFIKAILVEQQDSLAKGVVDLKRQNKIRLKVIDEDRVKATEDFLTDSVLKMKADLH